MTGAPAYILEAFTKKSTYDPGEKVIINIFISGAGQIDESQIGGHIPENLISGKIRLKAIDFKLFRSEEDEEPFFLPVFPPQFFELPNRFLGRLHEGYFHSSRVAR